MCALFLQNIYVAMNGPWAFMSKTKATVPPSHSPLIMYMLKLSNVIYFLISHGQSSPRSPRSISQPANRPDRMPERQSSFCLSWYPPSYSKWSSLVRCSHSFVTEGWRGKYTNPSSAFPFFILPIIPSLLLPLLWFDLPQCFQSDLKALLLHLGPSGSSSRVPYMLACQADDEEEEEEAEEKEVLLFLTNYTSSSSLSRRAVSAFFACPMLLEDFLGLTRKLQ